MTLRARLQNVVVKFWPSLGKIGLLFVPDENLVFCPEKTLTAVIAHIHYFPDAWKGQAHTTKVKRVMGSTLFPAPIISLKNETSRKKT